MPQPAEITQFIFGQPLSSVFNALYGFLAGVTCGHDVVVATPKKISDYGLNSCKTGHIVHKSSQFCRFDSSTLGSSGH
jgi:hypothetical protein